MRGLLSSPMHSSAAASSSSMENGLYSTEPKPAPASSSFVMLFEPVTTITGMVRELPMSDVRSSSSTS